MSELVKRIEQYMVDHEESQTSMAKRIGISGAALSQYLNGKYATPQTLEPKIEEFFRMAEMSSTLVKIPDFVETSISRVVMEKIQYCHLKHKMGIVYGDAGIGKTKAVRHYEQDHSEAVVISISPAFAMPTPFLKLLARKLRLPEGRRRDDTYIDLIEKLQGSEKVIVIDEAQHLTHSTLEIIRSLHDDAQIGIILIGNHEVYTKMLGKGEAAFAQLFSRIADRKNLLTSHIRLEDIKSLFPALREEAAKFLLGVSRTKWGIRGAANVFENSSNNSDLSLAGLTAMAKYMGIGV